jgi:lipopolysaccharide/colanic/teichoic acid biosynthesis glycosyltransferase
LKKSSEESFGYKYLKRAFDLAAASLALVVFAPVFARARSTSRPRRSRLSSLRPSSPSSLF